LVDVQLKVPWKPYEERIASLPFVRAARVSRAGVDAAGQADAVLSFETPDGHRHSLFVECKSSPLHGSAAQMLLRQLHHPSQDAASKWIVWAPYIDPIAGKQLAAAGVHYVDLYGNCRLAVGDQYLAHVERSGAPAKPAAVKGWRPASYRVLFAFLARTDLVALSTRELADHAGGVSPQTVADVRTKLCERGILIAARGTLRWSPGGYRNALDLWTHGFTTTLRPSLHIGRFRAKERDPHRLEAALAPVLDQFGKWGWGGGAACERLTHFYRGETTVVYLSDRPPAFPNLGGLVPDAQGPVSVLVSPGPLALPETTHRAVHPILAYADLLAEAEPRAAEGAAELYAQLVAPTAETTP
jgi:hypothetical protein